LSFRRSTRRFARGRHAKLTSVGPSFSLLDAALLVQAELLCAQLLLSLVPDSGPSLKDLDLGIEEQGFPGENVTE
jgi:hypothetical protein